MTSPTTPTFGITQFARRHTAASSYSHLEVADGVDHDKALLALVAAHWATARPSYRPDVLCVDVPATGPGYRFFSAVVKVTPETKLVSRLTRRAEGEEYYVETLALGPKSPATHVEIAMYSKAALASGPSPIITENDFEVVSVNARLQAEPEPMHPTAMARNSRAKPGGTPATYTDDQWAYATEYWDAHKMRAGTGG